MEESTGEQWRPIVGYGGVYELTYEVSSWGRVRRSISDKVRMTPRKKRRPHVLKLTRNSSGYPVAGLAHPDGKLRRVPVHTLVMLAFVGPRPEGHWCLHYDDMRVHNRLENLRWGTPAENTQDAIRNLGGPGWGKRRTQCPYGHELSGKNLAEFDPPVRPKECLSCLVAYSPETGPRPALADGYYLRITHEAQGLTTVL